MEPNSNEPDQPLIVPRRTYCTDGVDLTLIRWMLSLTPAERLQVLQNNVNAILRMRRDNPQL